jgi:hypothetical protein
MRFYAAIVTSLMVLAVYCGSVAPPRADAMNNGFGPTVKQIASGRVGTALDALHFSGGLALSRTQGSSPIEMSVAVGWDGFSRGHPDWVPVRVTLRNSSANLITGMVTIPDTAEFDASHAPLAFQSLYEERIVLPAATSKQVTTFLPGGDLGGRVVAAFSVGKRTLASASAFPTLLSDTDISIGAMTSDARDVNWLHDVTVRGGRVRILSLQPATLDPFPEVLANFDLIVISDIDTSSLNASQVTALERYVRNGGAVLVVGGPDALETFSGLPRSFLPGRVTGLKNVNGIPRPGLTLAGFLSRNPTTISTLRVDRGSVWGQNHGIPMVVRVPMGAGLVEFTAFDPAVLSFTSRSVAESTLRWLVTGAALQAVRRLSLPPDYRGVSFLDPGVAFSPLLGGLSGAPSAPLTLIVLVILIGAYIAAVGPLSLRIQSRLRHPERSWLAIPALAAVLIGLANVLAPRLQLSSTSLNEIGLISMDGDGPVYSARFYVGANSGAAGTLRLSYPQPALAAPIGPYAPNGPPLQTSLGWTFREAAPASLAIDSVPARATRIVALRTTELIPGSIASHLQLTSDGQLVGTIQNRTNLDLQAPALVSGQAFVKLGHLPPGRTIHVRLKPYNNIHDRSYEPLLNRIYGSSTAPSHTLLTTGSTLLDNIRGTIGILPESDLLSGWGSPSLVAWTSRPATLLSTSGASPVRHGLVLVVKPLLITFPRGTLTIRPGTLSAHLVDGLPASPHYPCCGPTAQSMFIGSGGSGTYEFDLPQGAGVSLRSLRLWVYGGSPDPSYSGYTDVPKNAAHVYDWAARTWTLLQFRQMQGRLSRPNRFVSTSGALLLRLSVPPHSTELAITDPQHDIQLSGYLVVHGRST